VAENPLEVDVLLKELHEISQLDTDFDGNPDGLCVLQTWSLHDLPYPAPPLSSDNGFAGFDPLGPREREALQAFAVMSERAVVEVVWIDGYASGEGNPAGNQMLSELRARAVADHLLELATADASRSLTLTDGLVPTGFGESMPLPFTAGEDDDHPLNRRVEIGFTVTKVAALAIDPTDLPSTRWQIGYDQAFSFYRLGGGGVGLGSLTRFGSPGVPASTRKFWYLAAGFGWDGSRLTRAAASVREKLRRGTGLERRDRDALALDAQRLSVLDRLERMLPATAKPMIDDLRKGWAHVTETFDTLALDADWATKTIDQKALDVLDAFGVSGLVNEAAHDGTFETARAYTFAEMEQSQQVLIELMVGFTVGVGASFVITLVPMWIFDLNGGVEFVFPWIAEGAVDAGVVPAVEVEISINVSFFNYR
jgi:hypothetical protein